LPTNDIVNLEIVNNGLYYRDKTFSDLQLCQVVYLPDTAGSLRNFCWIQSPWKL